MNDAMATALMRLAGVLIIAGLAAATIAAVGANVVWLETILFIIWGLLGLGVLLACLYAQAQREM